MAKRVRFDEPGAWHHVMNRGIARRTIVETRRDARTFLSHLARAVRAGWFEVHAYAILNTHFHLLLRSTSGAIWRGMRLFENGYVRWFNRARRRDGPLMRGRYHSKRVSSDLYWRTVIRYIDLNAISARIPFQGKIYPHCSAYHYHKPTGPPWLTRSIVESSVRSDTGNDQYDPKDYLLSFGNTLKSVEERLVEKGLDSCIEEEEQLDGLLSAAPQKIRSWMQSKARLADGTRPGLPVANPKTLILTITRLASRSSTNHVMFNGVEVDIWQTLTAGLLRWACGMTFEQVSHQLSCSRTTVHRRTRTHSILFRTKEAYADMATSVLTKVLQSDWGTIG